jgi:hypothetical protein
MKRFLLVSLVSVLVSASSFGYICSPTFICPDCAPPSCAQSESWPVYYAADGATVETNSIWGTTDSYVKVGATIMTTGTVTQSSVRVNNLRVIPVKAIYSNGTSATVLKVYVDGVLRMPAFNPSYESAQYQQFVALVQAQPTGWIRDLRDGLVVGASMECNKATGASGFAFIGFLLVAKTGNVPGSIVAWGNFVSRWNEQLGKCKGGGK